MASKQRVIRQDPDILNLLGRLPMHTAKSLTDRQLQDLKVAIGTGQYRKHKIDVRGTFPLPFIPSKVYFVFLMGRNTRALSRNEKTIGIMVTLLMTLLFCLLSTVLGLAVLYVVKSAFGIDLFEQMSLGLWDWLST